MGRIQWNTWVGPARYFPIPPYADPTHRNCVEFFHCVKYAFEEKIILFLASQGLGADRQKRYFFEYSVQQDETKGESKWYLTPRGATL